MGYFNFANLPIELFDTIQAMIRVDAIEDASKQSPYDTPVDCPCVRSKEHDRAVRHLEWEWSQEHPWFVRYSDAERGYLDEARRRSLVQSGKADMIPCLLPNLDPGAGFCVTGWDKHWDALSRAQFESSSHTVLVSFFRAQLRCSIVAVENDACSDTSCHHL